jgi:hypothetical protein
MKAIIGESNFQLAKCILFFFVVLVLSCTTTSVARLEGNDFKENLPGLWEGRWSYGPARSATERIEITKIDGNKVHLSGYQAGIAFPDTGEVYGRIENSTLYLTWPAASASGCNDELRMIRDDSNNLTLDGTFKCGGIASGKVRLKKIE